MPDQPASPVEESPYDLDDESTPAGPSEPVAAQTPPAPGQPAASSPPSRDPDTGRFTKPSWLTEQARDLGFTDADIENYTSDQLGAACTRMRQRIEHERTTWTARAAADQHQPTQPPAPEGPPAIDFGADPETGLPYTEKDLSPALVKVLKSQQKELHDLKSQLKTTSDRETQRALNTTRVLLDDAFEELGDTDVPLFGKGGIGEITPTEAKRRNAVANAAGINFDSDTPRTIAKKIKAARAELYPAPAKPAGPAYDAETPGEPPPGSPEPKQPAKPDPKVADWNKGGVAKPTQRKVDDLPNGKEKAARNLAKNAEKYGGLIGAMAADSAELADVPD